MSSTQGRVWFFDCDGVLLDSNRAKTDAFRSATAPYGSSVAADVVQHHLANGGMSRFAKFDRLFSDVLCRPPDAGEMEALLGRFATQSRAGLAAAKVDPSAHRLLAWIKASSSITYVASGGAQDEVRWALHEHGLSTSFDGVFGSPTPKREIVRPVLAARTTDSTPVFIGDSRLDMEVASEFGMHAVFVSHWSEFEDWQGFTAARNDILVVEDLGELLAIVSRKDDETGRALPTWLRSLP